MSIVFPVCLVAQNDQSAGRGYFFLCVYTYIGTQRHTHVCMYVLYVYLKRDNVKNIFQWHLLNPVEQWTGNHFLFKVGIGDRH